MKRRHRRLMLFAVAVGSLLAISNPAMGGGAWEQSIGGYLAAETQVFPATAIDSRQNDVNASLAAEFDFRLTRADNLRVFTFAPFGRLDAADPQRTHADVRELIFLMRFEDSDVLVGVGRVFWGATETVHWVDVINQTDLVENLNQESKLGQPMVNYNRFTDSGRFSLFVLPGFRERTFPGAQGRLRTHPRVMADDATYSSSAERGHVDFAGRWSHTIGSVDFGLSHFWGTVREPIFRPAVRGDGEVVLHPHYDIVHQSGLDVMWNWGDWLLKGEGMLRQGQGDEDFLRLASGIEYTFYGVRGTMGDVGVILEFLYDSQGDNDINPFENDLGYGLRLALNDLRDTTLLATAITDVTDGSTFLNLEGSRRLRDQWLLTLEARAFAWIPSGDFPLNGFWRDHYIQAGLEYHF